MPTLGQLLKKARSDAGLTQTKASKLAHIQQPTLSDYETDKVEPAITTVKALCKVYGTTISKLTKHLD